MEDIKVLVLDMDQTLLNASHSNEYSSLTTLDGKSREIAFWCYDEEYEDYYKMIGSKRPYVDRFLDYCFSKFDIVIIWSAGKENYVLPALRTLFKDKAYRPRYILTREDCQMVDGKYTKNLMALVLINPLINAANTVLVDDVAFNSIYTPDNFVLVDKYTFDDDDDFLLRLEKWFELTLFPSQDVRLIEKPFDNIQ